MQSKISKAAGIHGMDNDEDLLFKKIGYYISVIGFVILGALLYLSMTNKQVITKNYSSNIQDEPETWSK